MDAQGVYLYCFARAGVARGMFLPDRQAGQPALRLAGLPAYPAKTPVKVTGMNGGEVAAIVHGEVAGVVSHVSLEEFDGDGAERNTQNPEWVIPRAYLHDVVIQEAMRWSPVLPVRFGAVFASRGAVEELLARQGKEISSFLETMTDKEEWAVKGLMESEKAGAWLVETTPMLAEQRDRMSRSPGARYFQEKKFEAEVQKRSKAWQREVAERVVEELKASAADACPLRLQPKAGASGHGEMIFNCAFLVCRDGIERFRRGVEDLRERHRQPGLTFSMTGPWPPYNFCPSMNVFADRPAEPAGLNAGHAGLPIGKNTEATQG